MSSTQWFPLAQVIKLCVNMCEGSMNLYYDATCPATQYGILAVSETRSIGETVNRSFKSHYSFQV